jgi:hypothetical protein
MIRTSLACVVTLLAATAGSQAQTFKTLYAFKGGTDGGAPWAPPLLDGGNIFGTTYSGGGPGSAQAGTVYEYSPLSGLETYYYIFAGQPNDGAYPMSGLVGDGFGDYFGTTTQGGFGLRGTIYEISGGSEFVLYNFTGPDGETPEGNLVIDLSGNLYGITSGGGQTVRAPLSFSHPAAVSYNSTASATEGTMALLPPRTCTCRKAFSTAQPRRVVSMDGAPYSR